MRSFAWLATLATFAMLVALAGCDDSVLVQLRTGPQPFEVSAASLGLPAALRDDSTGSSLIASVACGPMGMCPASEGVPLTCVEAVCDPAQHTLSGPVGSVIDVEVLAAGARDLVRSIEAIEVVEARTQVGSNTLTVELPGTEIFWGPEAASDVDPAMGVVMIGWMPGIPAGWTGRGEIDLDPVGVAALSEYLVGTARRVRLFARTRVDLQPGDPFPEGSAQLTVDLTVQITGSVVR
jgi:hypothetical protein